MADHDDLDDLVDANDLVEVARATRVLVLRLDGIKGQSGVLSRIESASESLDKIDGVIAAAVQKVGDVSKLGQQIEQLPDRLLSKADSLGFRTAVSRIMTEEAGASIEKIQDVSLDRLDDEITHRMDRLADDLFGRKIEPSLRNVEAIARLKQEREDYKGRAEKAEKALADFKVLNEKTEAGINAQIERIRVSAKQPNRWALFSVFALGWGSALFAGAGWDVVTTLILGHTIPFPLPWR